MPPKKVNFSTKLKNGNFPKLDFLDIKLNFDTLCNINMNFSTYKVNPEKQTIRLSKINEFSSKRYFLYKELVGKKVRLRVQTCSFIFCVVIFFSHIIINVRRETAECNSYTNKKRANFTIRSWHID